MRTPVRASATVFIERIVLNEEEMTLSLRLEDVGMKMNGEASTPVAMLIKSGALDLTRPGNLAAHLPNLPPVIAEARDNRITLDFMRDPKLRNNELIRRAIGVVSSFVTVYSVQSERGVQSERSVQSEEGAKSSSGQSDREDADRGHVDVAFRVFPRGLSAAAGAFRRHVLLPGMSRLLPS